MKTIIFALLLVGQCFGLSFFKRSHRRHDDDPNYGVEETSEVRDMRNCKKGMVSCSGNLQKYFIDGSVAMTQMLRREGIADFCSDALAAHQCTIEMSNSEACSTIRFAALDGISKISGALEFICKQKFDEIQSNRDCVLNWNVYNSIIGCTPSRTREQLEPCSTAGLQNCVSAAVDAVKECKQEMKPLINDIVLKVHKVTCSTLIF